VPTEPDVAYLDASALVKLALVEDETDSLWDAVAGWPRRVTSMISVVEVLRTVRLRDRAAEPLARSILAHIGLLRVGDGLLVTAVTVEPVTLRALDAIHLASALRMRGKLVAFVSYDRRQLQGAEALGLPIASPR
jgi:predicted nucleic acid-binding protein